jgi:membrane protein required for colicin V production
MQGANWYDVVVALALAYGVWSGIRAGLSGEIIGVIGLVLMIVLAVHLYAPVGAWIHSLTGLAEEPSNLIAFSGIAVVVYLLTVVARRIVHARLQKLRFAAVLENVGGAFAGTLRMLVLMALLSIVLSLTRSPWLHEHIATKSVFGSFVVGQFPAVKAVVEKEFPEKIWFLDELQRRKEPAAGEAEPSPSR